MRAMTNEVRHMPVRRLMAGLLATSALASCAPQLQYNVPPSIAVDPGTRDVARQANAMLETYYASRGDFSPNDVVRLTFPYFPVLNTDQRVQLSGFLTPPFTLGHEVSGWVEELGPGVTGLTKGDAYLAAWPSI